MPVADRVVALSESRMTCRCATREYPHFHPECPVHRVLCKDHPNPVIREMAQAAAQTKGVA